jgi:hypothetical protein
LSSDTVFAMRPRKASAYALPSMIFAMGNS